MFDPTKSFLENDAGTFAHWMAVGLFFGVAAAWTLIRMWRAGGRGSQVGDWRWIILMGLLLFVGRWPWIIAPHEVNTDESQMIVGAHTLTKDPVFWRSVDGSTSGPLNFFAVVPLGSLFDWEGYLHARILGTLLLGATCSFMYLGLARLKGDNIARLAVLPMVMIEALSPSGDFNHYSTELLPVALMGATFYLMVRERTEGLSALSCALGGVLLGLVPLAKLQAIPLAGMQGSIWVILLLLDWRQGIVGAGRRVVYLCAGAGLPCAAFAMQVSVAGEWDTMVKSYIFANRYYVQIGASLPASLQTLVAMARMAIPSPSAALILLGALLVCGAVHARIVMRAARLFGLSLAATGVAITCVLLPGRDYPHYLQLVLLPLTWLCASLIEGIFDDDRRWRRLVFGSIIPAYGIAVLISQPLQPSIDFLRERMIYVDSKKLSDLARKHLMRGDRLAVWGWSSYLYVETGTTQATRRAMSQLMFEQGPLRLHFRGQYLGDLINSAPPVFIDSTGVTSLYYIHPLLRHDEQVPALAAYISSNYDLVEEYRGARIYRRKSGLAPVHSE